MNEVVGILQKRKFKLQTLNNPDDCDNYSIKSILDDFISTLKWIAKACNNHVSIDTFAKKLFITGNNEDLKKLKVGLSIYFAIIQCTRGIDKRYDSFFAAILEENAYSITSDINILSWNYDHQLELAYSQYSGIPNMEHNCQRLKMSMKFDRLLDLDTSSSMFRVFKINGSASISVKGKTLHLVNNTIKVDVNQKLTELLQHYCRAIMLKSPLYDSCLSFAWENEISIDKSIKYANTICIDTEVLIVIGYSFPFFNRKIDKAILNEMPNLKKIYIQDYLPDARAEVFKSIRPSTTEKMIIPIKDMLDQFYIPHEL